MKKFASAIVMVAFMTAAGTIAAGEREDAARDAALEWLALVDAGEYAESWAAAGDLFQQRVEEDEWASQVGGVREPLGDVKRRVMRSAYFTERVPGGPDGEYVIVQFDTAFENKLMAVETVTPVKEDGEWKVVGYYVN